MKSEELKAIQAPLKEKYKRSSSEALVTLKAASKLGENISCRIETGKALVEAGLHPATGGTGMLACSGDMLLEALAACAGVTLSAVATSMGKDIKQGIINVEGDIDFRGTLGVSKDVPVGFKEIRLNFNLESDANEEQINKLIALTERYCVVYQTLQNKPGISINYQKINS